MSDHMEYLELFDFDTCFNDDADAKVISVGMETYLSGSQVGDFMKQMFGEGKDLNFVAACECGEVKGNYNVGHKCVRCKTVVRSNFADEIKFRSWLEIPEFMPPVIHPTAYRYLRRWLGTLMDDLINPAATLPPEFEGITVPGMTHFHENFDKIIDFCLNDFKKFRTAAHRKKAEHIPAFISAYRDLIFIRHMPILNEALHMMTNSGTLRFSDEASTPIFKCLCELSNATYAYQTSSKGDLYLDNYMYDIFVPFIEYSNKIISHKLISKKGYYRKCMLGCQVHFSSRAVIRPLTGEHALDEIHIPWRAGVVGLKLEILNILMSRFNMTINEALDKHFVAQDNYDPEVDSIMKTLIEESPWPGLPIAVGRNPTLVCGAIQTLFGTLIKTDLRDDTLSISANILAAPNGDYDGDALYQSFLKEGDLINAFMNVHPSTTMVTNDVLELTDLVDLTKPARLQLHRFLKAEELELNL